VADLLSNGTPAPTTDELHTVVCKSSVGLVGLVVGRIEDVVPQPAASATTPPPQPPSRRGVIASLVVDDRVTELLDLETLVADAGIPRTA
jgi:chemotaxis signal transduction protein